MGLWPDPKRGLSLLGDLLLAVLAIVLVGIVIGYPFLQSALALFASD